MRLAYSAQAVSAQPGSLALTARTLSLGTLLCRCFLLLFFLLRFDRGRLDLDLLPAPDLLQVVELAHRGMHDVHHHVAEIHQHPLAGLLALHAVDRRAALPDALL